jgi:hypothetical protein
MAIRLSYNEFTNNWLSDLVDSGKIPSKIGDAPVDGNTNQSYKNLLGLLGMAVITPAGSGPSQNFAAMQAAMDLKMRQDLYMLMVYTGAFDKVQGSTPGKIPTWDQFQVAISYMPTSEIAMMHQQMADIAQAQYAGIKPYATPRAFAPEPADIALLKKKKLINDLNPKDNLDLTYDTLMDNYGATYLVVTQWDKFRQEVHEWETNREQEQKFLADLAKEIAKMPQIPIWGIPTAPVRAAFEAFYSSMQSRQTAMAILRKQVSQQETQHQIDKKTHQLTKDLSLPWWFEIGATLVDPELIWLLGTRDLLEGKPGTLAFALGGEALASLLQGFFDSQAVSDVADKFAWEGKNFYPATRPLVLANNPDGIPITVTPKQNLTEMFAESGYPQTIQGFEDWVDQYNWQYKRITDQGEVRLSPIEIGLVYDPDTGMIELIRVGDGLSFPVAAGKDVPSLYGRIFTHTHTRFGNPRLSPEDIHFAMSNALAEIRAVSPLDPWAVSWAPDYVDLDLIKWPTNVDRERAFGKMMQETQNIQEQAISEIESGNYKAGDILVKPIEIHFTTSTGMAVTIRAKLTFYFR